MDSNNPLPPNLSPDLDISEEMWRARMEELLCANSDRLQTFDTMMVVFNSGATTTPEERARRTIDRVGPVLRAIGFLFREATTILKGSIPVALPALPAPISEAPLNPTPPNSQNFTQNPFPSTLPSRPSTTLLTFYPPNEPILNQLPGTSSSFLSHYAPPLPSENWNGPQSSSSSDIPAPAPSNILLHNPLSSLAPTYSFPTSAPTFPTSAPTVPSFAEVISNSPDHGYMGSPISTRSNGTEIPALNPSPNLLELSPATAPFTSLQSSPLALDPFANIVEHSPISHSPILQPETLAPISPISNQMETPPPVLTPHPRTDLEEPISPVAHSDPLAPAPRMDQIDQVEPTIRPDSSGTVQSLPAGLLSKAPTPRPETPRQVENVEVDDVTPSPTTTPPPATLPMSAPASTALAAPPVATSPPTTARRVPKAKGCKPPKKSKKRKAKDDEESDEEYEPPNHYYRPSAEMHMRKRSRIDYFEK